MKLTMCRSSLMTLIFSATLLCSGHGIAQENDTAHENSADSSSHSSSGENPLAEISPELKAELFEAYKNRGADYKPRTEHFGADGSPQYINRLIKEDSPYLLQHAHNPVNWHPWGKEAFEKAKQQDKPLFLSIGYATCHWCHVMERESFENEEIARQMNEQFIAIKVDREQLPDVDAIYMLGLQVTTGGGGWPLSAFLQADGKLFHGATYMPPNVFSQTMNQIDGIWESEREKITEFAISLAEAIQQNTNLSGEARNVGTAEISRARESAMLGFDSYQGGFGPAPKFPRESTLYFLLDLAQRSGDPEALEAVDFSLIRMAAGGIHDQVGGGFHRYAVDPDWLIPHFEKMLYTQASLLNIYLQAFELTGNQEHARTARRIADYVIRDMTSDNGGFYSATDADSEGGEGLYFIWKPEEISELLTEAFSEEEAQFAMEIWGVSEAGNFEHQNILRLEDSLQHVAEIYDLDEATLASRLNKYTEVLLEYRDKRVPPLTDRKIITEWNAMMSSALIKAGRTLREPRYTEAAMRSIDFLLANNVQEDGGLWRAQFENRASTPASQADYAYLAQALLALYDEDGDSKWIDMAVKFVEVMNQRFWDEKDSGYFIGQTEVAGASLPSRPKDLFDNASPTGNSVALRVLVHLWNRTGDDQYRQRAESLVAAFSSWLARESGGFGYFLIGTNELLNGEVGAHRYAARGKVKASAVSTEGRTIKLNIDVAPGWHINAEKPLQDYLIPTKLSQANEVALQSVSYPEPILRTLGFQRSELSLYEGNVELTGNLPDDISLAGTADIELQLQACSDEICLPPETLLFKVPLAKSSPHF